MKKVFLQFRKIHRKIFVLELLFKKVPSLQGFDFTEKETPGQVFSCEVCKIFNKTYFAEYLGTTASVGR